MPTPDFDTCYGDAATATIYLCPLIKYSHWNQHTDDAAAHARNVAWWNSLGELPGIVPAEWDRLSTDPLPDVCAELYPGGQLPPGWQDEVGAIGGELEKANATAGLRPTDLRYRVLAGRATLRVPGVAPWIAKLSRGGPPKLSFGLWENTASLERMDATGRWLPEVNVCYTFETKDVEVSELRAFVASYCLGMFQQYTFLELESGKTEPPGRRGWLIGPHFNLAGSRHLPWDADRFEGDRLAADLATETISKGPIVQWRLRDVGGGNWYEQFGRCRGALTNRLRAATDPVGRLIADAIESDPGGGVGITAASAGDTLVVQNCQGARFFFAPVVVPTEGVARVERAALEHVLGLARGGLTGKAQKKIQGHPKSCLRNLSHGFRSAGGPPQLCETLAPTPDVRGVVYANADVCPRLERSDTPASRVPPARTTECPACGALLDSSGHQEWVITPSLASSGYFHS